MQKNTPIMVASIASASPDTTIQMTLSNKEPAPPPYTISLPNGKKARPANLKHCKPTGIPIIVIHHMMPAINQPIPIKKPPKTNQSKLPKQPKIIPPFFFYYSIGLRDFKTH